MITLLAIIKYLSVPTGSVLVGRKEKIIITLLFTPAIYKKILFLGLDSTEAYKTMIEIMTQLLHVFSPNSMELRILHAILQITELRCVSSMSEWDRVYWAIQPSARYRQQQVVVDHVMTPRLVLEPIKREQGLRIRPGDRQPMIDGLIYIDIEWLTLTSIILSSRSATSSIVTRARLRPILLILAPAAKKCRMALQSPGRPRHPRLTACTSSTPTSQNALDSVSTWSMDGRRWPRAPWNADRDLMGRPAASASKTRKKNSRERAPASTPASLVNVTLTWRHSWSTGVWS